jgi:hypothetical protein
MLKNWNAASIQQRRPADLARRREEHCSKRVNGRPRYHDEVSKREGYDERYSRSAVKDRP